jgi:hypothetical protein
VSEISTPALIVFVIVLGTLVPAGLVIGLERYRQHRRRVDAHRRLLEYLQRMDKRGRP